jgi:pimeloyl-ACP methyl ester carboxylesterase
VVRYLASPSVFLSYRLRAACLSLWISACAHPKTEHPAAAAPVGVRESFEEAPEFGGKLHVLQAGPVDGPPLVMIHGLGDKAARDLDPLLPALSERYRVLAFDLPGFGRSARVNEVYSPTRYARFVSGLVARHFPGRAVHVLGHSMGGAIALEFAGEHPEQVDKLMLLDVAAVLHYREYLREVIAGSARASFWKRALYGARKALFKLGMFPVTGMKLEDLALDANPGLRAFFSSGRTAALLLIQHDFGPAIRRVRAPTFLGWGTQDTVAPLRTAQMLRASLPVESFVLFRKSGHAPQHSEPAALLAALTAFLESTTPPPSRRLRPANVGRDGRCERSNDQVFEGDYDRIVIHRCKRVLLREVRAREIVIDRSQVELEHVELDALGVAATFRRSRVRWTGGSLQGEVCIETDHSALNLAGVRCAYRRESIRVRKPTRLLVSASVLSDGTRETPLHGEYELFRTKRGSLAEVRPRTAKRHTENSRPAEVTARDHAWPSAEDVDDQEGDP